MDRRLTCWVCASVLGLAACTSVRAGQSTNLLRNPGMNPDPKRPGRLRHWRPWKTLEQGEYAFDVDSEVYHSEPSSFRIRGSKPNGRACVGQNTVAAEPTRAYKMTIWYRTDGSPSVDGFVRVLAPGSNEELFIRTFRLPASQGKWTCFEAGFNMPEPLLSHKQLVFFFNVYCRGMGTVWYDSAELLPLDGKYTPPPPPDTSIKRVRELFLKTTLVQEGSAQCVIIVPEDGRYAEAVARVQQAIGVELPVLAGEAARPEDLLKTRHIIALGNMATNALVRRLYYRYYTFLDLWYPGKGGHVVRSLHNPFGTGRNVVFVGGSDAPGVLAAAHALGKHLRKEGSTTTIGRVMDIKLGEGLIPPDVGEQFHTWKDSFRLDEKGSRVGYSPGTVFGWNTLSMHAALYYMTGRQEYLREFVRLALPKDEEAIADLKELPGEAFSWHAIAGHKFTSPLTSVYHYYAHLMPLLWDLVEESPHLTDAERLEVTNALRLAEEKRLGSAGVTSIAARADPPRPGSRHDTYEALVIYTAGRYFATHYPEFEWAPRNLEHVKRFFSFWTRDTYYGVTSTGWYNTFNESVLDYFVLSGDSVYAESGKAEKMLSSTWVLWEGQRNEGSNRSQAVNMLRKAAWYLDDPKYAYFAHVPTYDLDRFRIGQSYAPSERLAKASAPVALLGKATVLGLSKHRHEGEAADLPPEEAYQLLSYRTEAGTGGDFLMLDGYFGHVSTNYHLQAITQLRIAGKTVLSSRGWRGYGCQLTVRRDGLSPTKRVPFCAALKKNISLPGMAYVHSQVPNVGSTTWDRHILHIEGDKTFVIDKVTAAEPGRYDMTASWQLTGRVVPPEKRRVGTFRNEEGATVSCATPTLVRVAPVGDGGWATVAQMHEARLAKREHLTILNMAYPAGHVREVLREIHDGAAVSVGPDGPTAWVGRGKFEAKGLAIEAEAAYVSPDVLVLVGATRLAISGSEVMRSAKPIDVCWRRGNRLHTNATRDTGTVFSQIENEAASPMTPETVRAVLKALVPGSLPAETESAPQTDWEPAWSVHTGEAVTDLCVSDRVWSAGAKGKLASIRDGRLETEASLGSPIRDLAIVRAGAEPAVVAGCGDWAVRAFASDGKPLWTHRCEPIPKGRWFSYTVRANKPEHAGVFAVVPIEGQDDRVAAVSTDSITLLDRDGRLVSRTDFTPLHRSPQGVVSKTAVAPYSTAMAAGAKRQGFFVGAGFAAIVSGRLFNVAWATDNEISVLGGFAALSPGKTNMAGKYTRKVEHVIIADLNANGSSELMYALSGSWNELRVYAGSGQPLWQKAFGPARTNSPFFRALDCADIDGDGKQEVLAGLEDGWVYVFRHDGVLAWSRRLDWPVSGVLGVPGRGAAIGTTAGYVLMLSPTGDPMRTGRVDGEIATMRRDARSRALVIGTAAGVVAEFKP
ncbi:MAG: VCBS repeat-containing protein [Lentisphaerae bacterium]|jgi:hypothetical protein|nr:VCBS repeat-containing protein [Lentisphaerota bacterium]MBT4823306.1 VCBS repeat-containing protein [Lentisphaerota bacterium]MBT5611497.1 VCBS repeat-containing protein [Lentisphaerota bacterium]MBT7057276.1 VCBS repeat-containing protein [Lentisphaerota bacterium]MBT7845773.1 VCBS repeat-containing protein [Lentisphaerota bacterium]